MVVCRIVYIGVMLYFKLMIKNIGFIIGFILLLKVSWGGEYVNSFQTQKQLKNSSQNEIVVTKNIQVKNYFQYIDSIVNYFNVTENLNLTEHVLVRYNNWIISTLAEMDYYKMIAKDSFIYNQKEQIVLKKGSKILIPNSLKIKELLQNFNHTYLDINIPEYKLRIYENSTLLFEFPVRVGRNEKKYLKMGNRITDLKTKTGIGKIVNHVKNPDFYNPVNGHQYFVTKRDDEKITKLPQIPWIETEINGIRNGQFIHPTTNQNTLSKPYSNGCIGTKESDAWYIYYYAPIHTKIIIRYDLKKVNKGGDTITFKNIYNY